MVGEIAIHAFAQPTRSPSPANRLLRRPPGQPPWRSGPKREELYDPMLVPTDGSQEMGAVVDQAPELAELCQAAVNALHVVDERAYYSVPDGAREQVRGTLREDAGSFTKAVATAAVDCGLEVVREVRWGEPPSGILAYASDKDIDLITMGTPGRTGYERYLLGNVAEKVVRMVPMPVLGIAVGDIEAQREENRTVAAAEPSPFDEPQVRVEPDEPIEGTPDEP